MPKSRVTVLPSSRARAYADSSRLTSSGWTRARNVAGSIGAEPGARPSSAHMPGDQTCLSLPMCHSTLPACASVSAVAVRWSRCSNSWLAPTSLVESRPLLPVQWVVPLGCSTQSVVSMSAMTPCRFCIRASGVWRTTLGAQVTGDDCSVR